MTRNEQITESNKSLSAEVAILRAWIECDSPPPLEALAKQRWAIARRVMHDLSIKDRHVYLVLEADPRPAVAAKARACKQELLAAHARFMTYSAHWSQKAVAANWGGYRIACAEHLGFIEQRIKMENDELIPLLGEVHANEPRAPERNWAASAWRIREVLDIA